MLGAKGERIAEYENAHRCAPVAVVTRNEAVAGELDAYRQAVLKRGASSGSLPIT